MKIDFYDLFSLHTPKDFPETGEGNYITAAVKSRVMENIPAGKNKPVRIRKIGKAFLAAAAAVVVLAMCTFAASALGIIDIEKIFGGMFRTGSENLDGITSVPQNVVITGDDRLSIRVLGIAGTENQFVGAIEIKRNDGGTFPQYIKANVKSGFNENNGFNYSFDSPCGPVWYDGIPPAVGFYVVDETTAIYYFCGGIDPFPYLDEDSSIMGKTYTVKISHFVDCTELENILQKYDVYIDNDEDAARVEYLLENEDVILDGEWFITFPIEYDPSCRKVKVNNEPFSGFGISSSVITEVDYSAISLDIFLDDVYGQFSILPDETYYASIKLDSGKEYTARHSCSDQYVEGGNPAVMHYYFYEAIDVDRVESITIGDVVIQVK